MTFLEACVQTYSTIVAGLFAGIVAVIIGVLTATVSRKWAWAFIAVPLIYLAVDSVAKLFVLVFIFVALGLPLLVCL